jgi:hypothetical protein
MFRCYFCDRITPPKTTRHSVVVEVREKQYSMRRRTPKRGAFRDRDENVQDRGGKGTEITKEVDACPECAARHHDVKTVANEAHGSQSTPEAEPPVVAK